ncbi:hypothetical protein SteCoe_8554 [Stentor coeruleus]|uniref:Uncharacterized protein n=1 Tax=Stentor coeruleus TaxID=5963 RepID=A0A1R2CJZ0_9CILI|nr:hypothetical protein SteCoe_8554 [Stentor coeruleus]
MKYLCLVLLVSIALSSEEIYNLDRSDMVLIPVNGYAKMKISSNTEYGIIWIPSRYEPRLEFENLTGDILLENNVEFQVFTAKCTEECHEDDFFLMSMMRTSGNMYSPPQEHAVMIRVIAPV